MTELADDLAHSLDAENPWPGLMPFTEATQAFFHGRDAEAAELFRRVRRERLTILFGQSGLGKTSLLSAGLFPRLRAADFLPVYLRLDLANPRLAPVAQIKAGLAESLTEHAVEGRPPSGDETLRAYFRDTETEFWNRRNRLVTPVLVLDQFEEIFTLGHGVSSVDALVDELVALIENRPPESVRAALEGDPEAARRYDFAKESCKLILAFREDFLPDLEGLRRRMPSIMDNRMRLTRMDGRQARDVILASGSHLVALGVADKVIAFVAASRGRSGEETVSDAELAGLEIEPALLSIVCRELNNKRIRVGQAQITADLLEGAQQEIVAAFYESSLAGIDPAVKLFIEDELLTSEGYRDSRPLADALREPGVTRADIDRLVARRLLRIEERFGTQWVELTHDLLTGVIRQQRDLRREQSRAAREAEERAQAERERAERAEAEAAAQAALVREAAEREQTARRLIQRTRVALAATVATLIVAIGALLYAVREQGAANAQADEAKHNYEAAIDAAKADIEIVDRHYNRGEIGSDTARALLDAARKTFSGLPSIREDAPTARARGGAHNRLGQVLKAQGDLAGALSEFRTCEQIDADLVAKNPKDVTEQGELANAHGWVGEILLAQRDLSGAEKEFQQQLAIIEKLAAADPANIGWQRARAVTENWIGSVLMAQGNLSGALERYEDSAAQWAKLAAQNPTNTDFQLNLAVNRSAEGHALSSRGDLPGALKEYKAELVILEGLIAKDRTNATWETSLADAHGAVAQALLPQGDSAQALRESKSSLDIMQRLVAKDPTNNDWQLGLANAHLTTGRALKVQGDLVGALQEFEAHEKTMAEGVAKDPIAPTRARSGSRTIPGSAKSSINKATTKGH